jgi:hypothetical protein
MYTNDHSAHRETRVAPVAVGRYRSRRSRRRVLTDRCRDAVAPPVAPRPRSSQTPTWATRAGAVSARRTSLRLLSVESEIAMTTQTQRQLTLALHPFQDGYLDPTELSVAAPRRNPRRRPHLRRPAATQVVKRENFVAKNVFSRQDDEPSWHSTRRERVSISPCLPPWRPWRFLRIPSPPPPTAVALTNVLFTRPIFELEPSWDNLDTARPATQRSHDRRSRPILR